MGFHWIWLFECQNRIDTSNYGNIRLSQPPTQFHSKTLLWNQLNWRERASESRIMHFNVNHIAITAHAVCSIFVLAVTWKEKWNTFKLVSRYLAFKVCAETPWPQRYSKRFANFVFNAWNYYTKWEMESKRKRVKKKLAME